VAILLGVDEAGYGPLLGPLCVGAVVIEAHGAGLAPAEAEDAEAPNPESSEASPGAATVLDLWSMLEQAVCRKPRDPRGRVAVDDSKKLKRPNDAAGHPLEHLERGVLSWTRCIAPAASTPAPPEPSDTTTDLALLRVLGAAPADAAPWSGPAQPLPLANDRGLLDISTQRLRRALEANRLVLHAIRVAALDAPDFNAAFERTRSKASVNTALGMERLRRVAAAFPDDEIIAAFDRHGGRTHYREELGYTFPDAVVRVFDESETASRYQLRDGRRVIRVSWETEAESRHLPVALASMAAKLVRELWMLRLNRYFAHFMPELKPTAGYVEDGRRWLAEVEPHLPRLGIDRRQLARKA